MANRDLRWKREHGVLKAYGPLAQRPGMPSRFKDLSIAPLFARVVFENGDYRVHTNDWVTTNLKANTEAEAKRIVEAMWALQLTE